MTKKPRKAIKFLKDCKGTSLMELIISLALTAGLVGISVDSFLSTSRYSYDNDTINHCEDVAQTVLDLMSYDIRMIGTGMPLAQEDFAIGGAGLGDSPLPILTTSDNEFIELRMNPKGRETVLTADYLPDPGDLEIEVLDPSDFNEGDEIYISDMTVGGTGGIHATINSIAGNTITIENTYVATPLTTFETGSTVSRVRTKNYSSYDAPNQLTMTDELGEVIIATGASFTLTYLDNTGTEIALPLTAAKIADELAAIRLTVTVVGDKPRVDGNLYTATSTQVIGLRNLNLARALD